MIAISLSVLASALLCGVLIAALKPLLLRYALARPNARSSHTTPTPQGGGIAVIGSFLLVAAIGLSLGDTRVNGSEFVVVGAALAALAVLGAVDDIKPLTPMLRLVLQIIAVAAVVAGTGDRILPGVVPLWFERGVLIFAGVWFVNLVNFMDGIDWITAAEMVPIAAFFALVGAAGLIPFWLALIGAALLGAMLGFAPFNKPVAGLFLGDVGSLPIGLLVGWMLLKLAGLGALAAAVLLPLYYLADATITLLRRLVRGERVWHAHRLHFYQQAIDRNGFSVMAVVTHVFLLNLALAALALATLVWPAWPVQLAALAAGGGLVAAVLWRFATPRSLKVLA